MNIKEHIEAGHYQRDGSGAAMVPMADGRVAAIFATNGLEPYCLLGQVGVCPPLPHGWTASGQHHTHASIGPRTMTLLPPAPLKVKVTRWLTIKPNGEAWLYFTDEGDARAEIESSPGWSVVKLEGEYERPWECGR